MSSQVSTTKPTSVKALLSDPQVMGRLSEVLGKKQATFATSVMQIVNSSDALKSAEPTSVLNCALVAVTLDLPLNNNLGFAWIVPFKKNFKDKEGKWQSTTVAQFQIGYRGFIQLALRTGQYEALNCIPVYKNQFESFNSLTEELKADFSIDGEGEVVGYCTHFRLISGFNKTVYWSRAKAEAHGKKFSKTFASGPWKDDFDSMAMKTVLKLTLAKWGPMSVEMQKAITTDQGLINDQDGSSVEYPDNTVQDINHEEIRQEEVIKQIEENLLTCHSLDDLDILMSSLDDELQVIMVERFEARKTEIENQ